MKRSIKDLIDWDKVAWIKPKRDYRPPELDDLESEESRDEEDYDEPGVFWNPGWNLDSGQTFINWGSPFDKHNRENIYTDIEWVLEETEYEDFYMNENKQDYINCYMKIINIVKRFDLKWSGSIYHPSKICRNRNRLKPGHYSNWAKRMALDFKKWYTKEYHKWELKKDMEAASLIAQFPKGVKIRYRPWYKF